MTHRNNIIAKQNLILVTFCTVMYEFGMHCHLLLRNIKMHLRVGNFQQQNFYNQDGVGT